MNDSSVMTVVLVFAYWLCTLLAACCGHTRSIVTSDAVSCFCSRKMLSVTAYCGFLTDTYTAGNRCA